MAAHKPSRRRMQPHPPFPAVRLLYALAFAIVAWFVFWIVLLAGARCSSSCIPSAAGSTKNFASFSINLVQYLWELLAFITFVRDEQPFPIGPFPQSPDRLRKVTPRSAIFELAPDLHPSKSRLLWRGAAAACVASRTAGAPTSSAIRPASFRMSIRREVRRAAASRGRVLWRRGVGLGVLRKRHRSGQLGARARLPLQPGDEIVTTSHAYGAVVKAMRAVGRTKRRRAADRELPVSFAERRPEVRRRQWLRVLAPQRACSWSITSPRPPPPCFRSRRSRAGT